VNTRLVDPRTIWALLAMEAGLALPIISLPAQGDRLPGVLGPLLLLVLLPLGFAGVLQSCATPAGGCSAGSAWPCSAAWRFRRCPSRA
jgi:hypothetical protein